MPFAHWVTHGQDRKLREFQSIELGLWGKAKVTQAFIDKNLAKTVPLRAPDVQLVLVAERMDTSLILLRRLMARSGWDCDLLDLVHMNQAQSVNWRGQAVRKSNMTAELRQTLLDRNPVDHLLWQAASDRIDDLVRLEKALDDDGGKMFDAEVVAYHGLHAGLKRRCEHVTPIG